MPHPVVLMRAGNLTAADARPVAIDAAAAIALGQGRQHWAQCDCSCWPETQGTGRGSQDRGGTLNQEEALKQQACEPTRGSVGYASVNAQHVAF